MDFTFDLSTKNGGRIESSADQSISTMQNSLRFTESVFPEANSKHNDEIRDEINWENNETSSNTRMKSFLRIRGDTETSELYQIQDSKLTILHKLGKKPDIYLFDSIFQNTASQFEIFQKCALPLIKDFMLGQNSLLFTFGVTSSGKTFTMKGTSHQPGIIPYSLVMLFNSFGDHLNVSKFPQYKPQNFCDRIRLTETNQNEENSVRNYIINQSLSNNNVAVEQFEMNHENIIRNHKDLIQKLKQFFNNLSDSKQEVSIWISYFEIYNDNLIDLLSIKFENQNEPKLMLNQDKSKNYYINGLRQTFVTTATEAYLIYLYGQQNLKKHISQTKLNEASSRSHSIFRITMIRIDAETKISTTSQINFCDLAGAERIAKTGNTGQRANETNKINQSLSALNHCISALNSKKNNQVLISYRASKLTHVLQPYLFSNGGSFCIIFNLNPSPLLFEESTYSLSLCDSLKEIKPTVKKSYRRRLTIKPTFMDDMIETEDDSADEESFDDDDKNNSLVAFYENIIQEKDAEFNKMQSDYREYVEKLKDQNEQVKISHQKEIEELKYIHNAKMDINNANFETNMMKKDEKIDELETRLLESDTKCIEKQEIIHNMKKEINKKEELIKKLKNKMEDQIEKAKIDHDKAIEEKNREIDELKATLLKSQTKCVDMQATMQEMKEKINNQQKFIGQFKDDLIKLEKTLAEKSQEFEKIEKKLSELATENPLKNPRSDVLNDISPKSPLGCNTSNRNDIAKIPKNILQSLSTRKRKKENQPKVEQSMDDIQRVKSGKKLRIQKCRSSELLSPDTVFQDYMSEKKLMVNENDDKKFKYQTRSRKRLF